MRDYLSLPPSQTDTVRRGEMEWLSHAISGSPRQSSKLNLDSDFQETALFAKPSFQPKAKEMRAVTLRQQPGASHYQMNCHQVPLCLPHQPPLPVQNRHPGWLESLLGQGGGPCSGVPRCWRACFCSTDPGRWPVTWGWLEDLSWRIAWGGSTGAEAQCELQCWVSPVLPRAPCTVRGDARLLALRWLILVQKERKTWTVSLIVAWQEQRNKVHYSWKSTHYGEISQSWQEYYFDKKNWFAGKLPLF